MLNTFDDSSLVPGFTDPVLHSQTSFRSVLDAMSRPGTVVGCGQDLTPPAPIHPATASFLLTVTDFETPVWLPAALSESSFAAWLKFHTSCPTAATPDVAVFAAIHDVDALPPLSNFAQGTEEYPDRSTTVVIQINSFGEGQPLQLSGPGIEGASQLSVHGLPASFWDEWRKNTEQFPRGVDLVLTAGSQLAALPRTTRVEF